jgi:hypothetical protein
VTGLDQAIREWFSTRLETMPCDDDLQAHESLQMAAHALLAVLDPHPEASEQDAEWEHGPHWPCVVCHDGPWPCVTVRRIAEKLGVEHD